MNAFLRALDQQLYETRLYYAQCIADQMLGTPKPPRRFWWRYKERAWRLAGVRLGKEDREPVLERRARRYEKYVLTHPVVRKVLHSDRNVAWQLAASPQIRLEWE